jgi:Fe-S cluster assembly iron-binding protein IscA
VRGCPTGCASTTNRNPTTPSTSITAYIGGSKLDFESGLQGAGFHVENPNVVSECGCGESFRT